MSHDWVYPRREFREHSLCKYGNEIHDFGYALATRVGHVIVQRLQATRLQCLTFPLVSCPRNSR